MATARVELIEGDEGGLRRRFAPAAPMAGALRWAGFALLFLLASFVLFAELGEQPLVMWDEARIAVNALEMNETGDFVVARYGDAPDLWNVKPPLLLWAQALLLDVVDDPELAIRLPAALATLATVLLVFWFGARGLGDPLGGFLGALVLLGTPAFVGYHAARNGDYDAPLTFWTTLYAIAWLRYLGARRTRDLLLFAGALALAMLTKGVAGGMMGPGLLLFTLLDGRLGAVLRDRRAWLALAAALSAPLAWYAARELQSPGYVAAVLHFELGQFFHTVDGHAGGTHYYVTAWLGERFFPWSLLLPVALAVAWRERRRVVLWAACAVAGYLFVVEASGTKLPWYDLPAYPQAALVLGLAASTLLRRALMALAPLPASALGAATGLLLMLPVLEARTTVLDLAWDTDPRLDYGDAIAGLLDRRILVLDGGVANAAGFPNYNAVLRFHADLARERGVEVEIVHPGYRFRPGEEFLTCDPEALDATRRQFGLSSERKVESCTLARVASAS